MKLGQMASYLDDGLPEPLRLALSQLQSNAPPMSIELSIATIERELGPLGRRAVRRVRSAIRSPRRRSARCIGRRSSTVAGVERAVAVKVQYPGVDEAIVADLRNADLLGAVLRAGLRRARPGRDGRRDQELRIAEELDYELEARNQQLFADYYRDHPFITIPEVVPELSTRRVLTTELVEGFTWAELMQRDRAARDRAGEVIFRFVFRSLYRMGAFNGDPHPGNYLFHDDGTVTFLDFGLVKHFSAEEMSTFGSMVKAAAVDHDHAEFRSIVEGAGMLQPGAPVSTEAVGEYFSHFYDTVRTDTEMTWTREYAQLDRAAHVRPLEPHQPVRNGAREHSSSSSGSTSGSTRCSANSVPAATIGASRPSCGPSSTPSRPPISDVPRPPGSPRTPTPEHPDVPEIEATPPKFSSGCALERGLGGEFRGWVGVGSGWVGVG